MALKHTPPNLARYRAITPQGELEKYVECYATRRYGADPRKAGVLRLPELSLVGPGDAYLDVGCGRGENLRHVKNIQPTATVRGTEMVPALQGEFVQDARLPELAGVEPADVVSCYEVLEHLPVHDVLPALDRLVALTRKILVLSTNDMPSMSFGGITPLHLSRFTQMWWLKKLEEICMARGGELTFRPQRHIVQREDVRRFWMFMLDFRDGYKPFNFQKCHFHGYDSDMTEFWFWHAPKFPVSEISRPVRSSAEVLNHPAVKALWRDLDKNGLQSPVLLHNIPGQPNRRYWPRCGNHRVEWAMTRGLETINALVYGGCEFEPCEPMTMRQANRKISDGKLSFAASQAPNVIDVKDWYHENTPFAWDAP